MRFLNLIHLLFLLPQLTISQGQNKNKSINQFLKLGATQVKEQTLEDNLGYFINNDFYKNDKQFTWLKGSVTASSGELYENVRIKFNTINNSVYLKNDDKIYRISSSRILEFSIMENDQERKFRKGFIVAKTTQIAIQFDMKSPEFLRILMSFVHFDKLDITNLTLGNKGGSGSINIELRPGLSNYAQSLKHYLNGHDGVEEVKLQSSESDTNENTFFEVLFEHEKFHVLKWNYKKISAHEAVALAKNSITRVFEEESYYFSNENDEISRFIFSRRSIHKGLTFAGVDNGMKPPAVRNERKLLSWLNQMF
ncbi:MAG: hypothetical protein RIM99_04950 [Cyclobacteriaceae bacterium]